MLLHSLGHERTRADGDELTSNRADVVTESDAVSHRATAKRTGPDLLVCSFPQGSHFAWILEN